MVIFWNFAGVPFVSCPYNISSRLVLSLPILVLRLLRRIYGFTRPIQVPVLNFYLHRHVHYSINCLLHVRLSHPRPTSY